MDNPEKMTPENMELRENELDLNYVIYLRDLGRPITCEDVGGKDIVIPPEAFEVIGSLEIINSDGEVITIDLSDNTSDSPLVIRSDELGE